MARTPPRALRFVANDMHLSIGVPIIWYRASMVFPDARQPAPPSGSPASRCPASRAWSSAATVMSRGDSPTPAATGATSSAIEPDPRDRHEIPDARRAASLRDASRKRSPPKARPQERSRCAGRSGGRSSSDGRARARIRAALGRARRRRLATDITGARSARERSTICSQVVARPRHSASERRRWPIAAGRIALDDRRRDSAARRPRRHDAGIVGRRHAALERLSHRRRVPVASSIRRTAASGPRTRRSSTAPMLATIGEGGYADGIRARVIRDRLMAIDKATPQDMLDIQLEDRALFLERWRDAAAGRARLVGRRGGSSDPPASRVPQSDRHEVDAAAHQPTRSAIVSSRNSGPCSCAAS